MNKGHALDRITNGVAGVGLTMPAWERELIHMGEIATALVPILSALWLAVQILGYARKRLAK
jgi:hypothetical protein